MICPAFFKCPHLLCNSFLTMLTLYTYTLYEHGGYWMKNSTPSCRICLCLKEQCDVSKQTVRSQLQITGNCISMQIFHKDGWTVISEDLLNSNMHFVATMSAWCPRLRTHGSTGCLPKDTRSHWNTQTSGTSQRDIKPITTTGGSKKHLRKNGWVWIQWSPVQQCQWCESLPLSCLTQFKLFVSLCQPALTPYSQSLLFEWMPAFMIVCSVSVYMCQNLYAYIKLVTLCPG